MSNPMIQESGAAHAQGAPAIGRPSALADTELVISRGRAKGSYRVMDIRQTPPVHGLEGLFLAAHARVQPQGWHPAWRILSETTKTVNTSIFGTASAIDMWIADIKAAHIDFCLVRARAQKVSDIMGNYSAEDLIKLIQRYPNKVGGIAPVNLDHGIESSIDELDKALASGILLGAHMENGYTANPLSANDPSFFPLYDFLSSKNCPLMFLTGPFNGSKITRLNNVDVFDDIMTMFPKLKVIAGHGGYPYVTEMMGCAYKHANFFILPDLYAFCPGGELYISNMNKLPDQFLFGTGYPIGSIAEMVAATSDFDIDRSVMENYLYNNSARVFGLA